MSKDMSHLKKFNYLERLNYYCKENNLNLCNEEVKLCYVDVKFSTYFDYFVELYYQDLVNKHQGVVLTLEDFIFYNKILLKVRVDQCMNTRTAISTKDLTLAFPLYLYGLTNLLGVVQNSIYGFKLLLNMDFQLPKDVKRFIREVSHQLKFLKYKGFPESIEGDIHFMTLHLSDDDIILSPFSNVQQTHIILFSLMSLTRDLVYLKPIVPYSSINVIKTLYYGLMEELG